MAKNKTVETTLSVNDYIDAIADATRKADFKKLVAIFKKVSGYTPKMWGTGIVGFGSYHYVYESGHSGDAPLVALASRANAISLYLSSGFKDREAWLKKFGKHKSAKACIYIQKLADVDEEVLSKMIALSIEEMQKKYPK